MNRATVRRGAVFAVLRLALGGITLGIGGGAVSVLLAAALLGILYLTGFRMALPMGPYVPVEITRGDKRLHLTALRDTGNTLRDPVTGNPVLVIGAQAAQMLTGLTREQLRSPVESVGAIPGLRLVPYRAVGREDGLMLALKFQDVRIGKWKGSHLVAFAPEGLGDNGSYDALTGGAA
jgi:stage II sporulation protein GA (sporulation sigma-E factor processing peptidase)